VCGDMEISQSGCCTNGTTEENQVKDFSYQSQTACDSTTTQSKTEFLKK
jgi:hypothetical protein